VTKASPFLNTALTRWASERVGVRKEAGAATDGLKPWDQILDDQRRILIHGRQTILQDLEAFGRAGQSRWAERLRRVDEWKETVAGYQAQADHAAALCEGVHWFEAAERLSSVFCERAKRRAGRLEISRGPFHAAILEWESRLNEKEAELKSAPGKSAASQKPLLVSRARKQPEVDFVKEQDLQEPLWESELRGLRRSVNHWLGRIYLIARRIESNAAAHPALFEPAKNQLQADLQEPQKLFFALRERVLDDALHYEACRHRLRSIRQRVQAMRCVEDVYSSPEPFWKRWARALVPKPRPD